MCHLANDVKTSREPDAPERAFAVTFGSSLKQAPGSWNEQHELTWRELTEILTDHREGPKDGPCIVPATLRQPERKADNAREISLLALDSDSGHTLEEIKTKLEKHGYAAIIHSTHSHMLNITMVSRFERERFNGNGTAGDYLIQKKRFLPGIAMDAMWWIPVSDSCETIKHSSCPKYRIILPLDRPWRASDYEDQEAANKAWRERYRAAAHHLKLEVDPACSDPCRLFFLPRHDPGEPFEALVVEGKDFPIWSLAAVTEETKEKLKEPPEPEVNRDGQGTSVIAAFNAKYSPEAILERNAYRKAGNKYICPNSTSGMPGVSIKGGRAFSHHSSDPLFTGDEKHAHDAFSIFQVLEHGNEQTEAVRAAAAELGLDSTRSAPSTTSSSEEWEEPTDLTRPIPPAPPFPGECLPYRLLNWASDVADRMQTRLDMVAISMIIVCAGLIGKDVYLRPKSRDNWKERPCLWGMLISPPASMKSQALSEGTVPLRRIQASMAEGDAERLKEWKTLKSEVNSRLKAHKRICDNLLKEDPNAALPPIPDAAAALPNAPNPRRLLTSDATIEKLADLMIESPGLTLARDELAGFLLNMSRYNAGSDRQFYLECHSGGGYSVDRIIRGTQSIKSLYLNIIGTIQPGVARKLFSINPDETDGFFERFGLMIYPEPLPVYTHTDRWPCRDKRKLWNSVCDRLAETDWKDILSRVEDQEQEEVYCRFDEEAQEEFDQWLIGHKIYQPLKIHFFLEACWTRLDWLANRPYLAISREEEKSADSLPPKSEGKRSVNSSFTAKSIPIARIN